MSDGAKQSPARGAPAKGESTNTAPPASPSLAEAIKTPYLIIMAGAQVGELHKIGKERTVVGRSPGADIRIIDDGISREHVAFVVNGERVVVHDLGSTNGTYINGARAYTSELTDGDKISIGATTILKFSYQDGIDEQYQQGLYQSAVRDGLTQALKREYFLERLDGEIAFSIRHAVPLALILWDLDRFKTVNDRFGHPAGDRVLEATARAVMSSIRREDLFGRYGGEEFALACRATAADRALFTANRLREVIEETAVDVGPHSLRVTASFGVAICPASGIASVAELVAVVDAAMYRAKASGRNRVEMVGAPGAGKDAEETPQSEHASHRALIRNDS